VEKFKVRVEYFNKIFYIHGSVHRQSILIRSNKMQLMQVFIYCKITLHVSGVYRTHHQEYIKLQLQFDVLLMMGAIDTRNM